MRTAEVEANPGRIQPSASRTLFAHIASDPSSEELGYFQASALADLTPMLYPGAWSSHRIITSNRDTALNFSYNTQAP
jgi:hypothetical protein